VVRLNQDINRVFKTTDMRERLAAVGAEPEGGSPELLGHTVKTEVRKWNQLVRVRNLRFEP
jgi:tripartite-type tricarboxylate transporter receptor subunit TctC